MAFRVLNQNPAFFILNGSELTTLAGGSLTFYENGTTTPKDTFSDAGLTIPNTNPVTLDAEGRSETDIWGSGKYTVVLKNAVGATQWTRNDVQADSDIPDQSGHASEFLTTDGTDLSWAAVSQVPDVTGQTGKVLTNDGMDYFWGSVNNSVDGTTITNVVLVNAREKVQVVTAIATLTVDIRLGSVIELAQAVNCIITVIGQPAAGEAMPFTIIRTKDATGNARTLTVTASWWPGGVAVPVTQTSGACDTISMLASNARVNLLGSYNTALA